jgi:hypothetical protein
MLRTIFLFLALAGTATAQSRLAIDFGVRGGVTMGQFVDNPACCHSLSSFGTQSFTEESRLGTVGPTASLVVNDWLEFRFEAVRKHAGYRRQGDLVVQGSVDSHSTTIARGTLWEFPVLVTYRFRGFTLRPYAGGGIGGGSMHLTFDTHNTSTSPQTGVTTSGVLQGTEDHSVFPIYGVVGLEKRMSLLSIRPEVRFRHDLNNVAVSASTRRETNQLEFVVGLTIHPFHR